MILLPKHRLIVWACLICVTRLGSIGATPCQASDNGVPKPQLSQADPAYAQLMNALKQVGQARHAVVENLSNAKATAYKRNCVRFNGSDSIAVTRDLRPGGLVHTGRKLDWAIEGAGWFQVLLPDGRIGYTRRGTFSLDTDGTVVSEQGFSLEPAISVPTDIQTLDVARDGTVSCMQGDGEVTTVGTIQLARFTSPESLRHHSQVVYLESEPAGTPVIGTPGENGRGCIQCGFLENANVNTLQEQHLLEDLTRYEAQLHQVVAQVRPPSSVTTDSHTHQTEFGLPLEMLHAGFEFRTHVEQRLAEKAEELLFAIVGAQRAKVSVSAELDLEYAWVTRETETPGEAISEETEDVKEPVAPGETGTSNRTGGVKSFKSEKTEYAVSLVKEKRVSVPGRIEGVSVAVLIDLRDPAAKNNRLLMSIDDVEQLVRAALGLKSSDVLVIKQLGYEGRFEWDVAADEEESTPY
jgi:flagellar basal body rod protein FlgF